MKILARVKFNDRLGYVLDKKDPFIYTKKDNVYIGRSGIFYDVLVERLDKHAQSFAGREVSLTMSDGSTYKNTGSLWSELPKNRSNYLPDLYPATTNTRSNLRSCYVFCGDWVDAEGLRVLQGFKGDIYKYYEYEKYLKGSQMTLQDLIQELNKWRNKNMPIFIDGKPLNRNMIHCAQKMAINKETDKLEHLDVPFNIDTIDQG